MNKRILIIFLIFTFKLSAYDLLNLFHIEKTDRGEKLAFIDNEDMYFPLGIYEFDEENLKRTKQIAMFLKANPDCYLIVEGHSDINPYENEDEYGIKNTMLSYYRSLIFLQKIRVYGNFDNRIITLAYGYKYPKYTEADKIKNRRLEFIVLSNENELKKLSKYIKQVKDSLIVIDENIENKNNEKNIIRYIYKDGKKQPIKYTYREGAYSPEVKIGDAVKCANPINTIDLFYIEKSERGYILKSKDEYQFIFNKNSYDVRQEYSNMMQNVGMFIDANPDLYFVVEGHSNPITSDKKEYLSYKRALSFSQEIEKYGNYMNRIIPLGYDDKILRYDATNYKNRRLEFVVLQCQVAVKGYLDYVKKHYSPDGYNVLYKKIK
mgnify:CR=1 FL=1